MAEEGQSVSQPIFVRTLSKQEAGELERLVRKGRDAREMRRAQAIRLSAQGRKAWEIAELLGMTRQSVMRFIDAFNREGIKGLSEKPRSGRPPKATDEYIRLLKEAVATPPAELGYPFSSWTTGRLREHLARECHVVLHPDYLSRLMARHGIVYRRPRHVMDHLRDQQEYDEKKEIVEFLKKARAKGGRTSTSCSSTSVKFTCTRS
jgi:transposase